MKNRVKSFIQFIKESHDMDDPRNNDDQDPQRVIDQVLISMRLLVSYS